VRRERGRGYRRRPVSTRTRTIRRVFPSVIIIEMMKRDVYYSFTANIFEIRPRGRPFVRCQRTGKPAADSLHTSPLSTDPINGGNVLLGRAMPRVYTTKLLIG